MFDRADKNRDGRLDMDEILQLLRKLNVRASRTEIKHVLKVGFSTAVSLTHAIAFNIQATVAPTVEPSRLPRSC